MHRTRNHHQLPTPVKPVVICPVQISVSPIPAVNVATVPQRSPLRYPGGKTWLVPHIRAWLGPIDRPPELLVEPFAGGAIVSLTAVMEKLSQGCLMAELDADVAALWQAILDCPEEIVGMIEGFEPTRDNVEQLEHETPQSVARRGFRTLVLNRTRRGGILAEGASLNRRGENGKGVASRWYPETIIKRIGAVSEHRDKIEFRETDGMAMLEQILTESHNRRIAVFLDPPYTAGGKRAGLRLYNHNCIDHSRLYSVLKDSGVDFLMTYDESPQIHDLVSRHGFHAVRVVMKNTHHDQVTELVISQRDVFRP